MQDLLYPILLAIHMMLALTLIAVVLLQKSEGGLGGLGGGGGGMSGFMSGRGTANLLTRTTRWLAAGFMATSLAMAWLATHRAAPESIIVPPTTQAPTQPTLDLPVTAPTGQADTGTTGSGAPTSGTTEPATPAAGASDIAPPAAGATGTTEPAVPTTNQ